MTPEHKGNVMTEEKTIRSRKVYLLAKDTPDVTSTAIIERSGENK